MAVEPQGAEAAGDALDRRAQDLQGRHQNESGDAQGAEGLELVVAVGVVAVGGGVGEVVGDQPHQAGEAVGGAVHRIGQHRQGAGEQADHQLQQAHAHIHRQGHQQHPLHGHPVVTPGLQAADTVHGGRACARAPQRYWVCAGHTS